MGNVKEQLLNESKLLDESNLDQEVFTFESRNVLVDQTWLVGHLFKSGVFNKDSVVNDIHDDYSHKKWLFVTPSFANSLSHRGEIVVRTVVGNWWGVDELSDRHNYDEIIRDIYLTEGSV